MKRKQNQSRSRVLQLLDLDDELNTLDLLREHIPSELLYLVDRRCWLVEAIRKNWEAKEDRQLDLFSDDESRDFDGTHCNAVRREVDGELIAFRSGGREPPIAAPPPTGAMEGATDHRREPNPGAPDGHESRATTKRRMRK
jgi:hypothetical protein